MGNIVAVYGDKDIAKVNPFRYRGYYQDNELGLIGAKRTALIAAATIGGIALGAFLGPYVARLGSSEKAIFDNICKIVKRNLPNAVDGSNQIHTMINGIKVTIRFYVSNGEVQSIDAFVGWASRVIGKLL